jgi:hypothetical protein
MARRWKGKFAYAELITGLVRERGKQRCAQPVEAVSERKSWDEMGKGENWERGFYLRPVDPVSTCQIVPRAKTKRDGREAGASRSGPVVDAHTDGRPCTEDTVGYESFGRKGNGNIGYWLLVLGFWSSRTMAANTAAKAPPSARVLVGGIEWTMERLYAANLGRIAS